MIRAIADGLGLGTDDLAASLGVSPRTIEQWRAATSVPPVEARQRLGALVTLTNRLHDTFDSEDIPARLLAANRYLGRLTPSEAIRLGRLNEDHAGLETIDSGIFL